MQSAHVTAHRRLRAASMLVLTGLVVLACEPWPALVELTPPAREPVATTARTASPRPSRAAASTRRPKTPTAVTTAAFDFYVLALSWSPDYCAASGGDDPQQCSVGRRLAFVLHGLWPQYERGYPSSCSAQKLPADVQAEFPDLFPSPALYAHEWEKHGTCSGLSPEAYLTLAQRLKAAVVIPRAFQAPAQPFRTTAGELRASFTAVNPEMSGNILAPACSGSGRYLQGLYVCFTVAGTPRPCSGEMLKESARSCRASFTVRNVR